MAKYLLSRFFNSVDLVEGNQRLLDSVPRYMMLNEGADDMASNEDETTVGLTAHPCLGELFCDTLQSFEPEAARYDCIWVQWVVIYLTDVDFVMFLKRCARGLKPGGVIVIKENVLAESSTKDFILDDEDSSLTRSQEYMKHIFKEAGLSVSLEATQQNWDRDMLPVLMYALEPR